MEYKHEDSSGDELFLYLFNEAYKKANNANGKFHLTGWSTDMATSNFNGLERIYGEVILAKIKGCKFHFKDSVNKHAKFFEEEQQITFKALANELLIALTEERYRDAYQEITSLIFFNEKSKELLGWLNWWHGRRAFIFRAFARLIARQSNLAEVVHASWKNRDKMGVTLLESCIFYIRDSLLLEADIQNFIAGSCMNGFGPNQEQLQKRKIERLLEAGEKYGEEIKKHGISSTAPQMIQKRTNEEDTGNQNIKKKKLIDPKLHKRLNSAIEQENCIKIRKSIIKNNSKHTYHVSSSSKGKVTYLVDICCSSSCTCPGYRKIGKEVYCKHILFSLNIVMQAPESLFKEKLISHGVLKNS